MSRSATTALDSAQFRQLSLARWDNEGGAGPLGAAVSGRRDQRRAPSTDVRHMELVQLHIRIIALENLVVALLAESSPTQIASAGDMAAHIAPRKGFTDHPLTTHAATRLRNLVERANHFRNARP